MQELKNPCRQSNCTQLFRIRPIEQMEKCQQMPADLPRNFKLRPWHFRTSTHLLRLIENTYWNIFTSISHNQIWESIQTNGIGRVSDWMMGLLTVGDWIFNFAAVEVDCYYNVKLFSNDKSISKFLKTGKQTGLMAYTSSQNTILRLSFPSNSPSAPVKMCWSFRM